MADALTQYKLIILYMMDKVDAPLMNTQISNFILEKEYTTYFTLQQAISELSDAGLVHTESTHNNTYYRLTASGRETLSFFLDKISDAIKEDVIAYCKEHQMELKQEIHALANYYKTDGQKYAARCQLKERDQALIDLTIRADSRAQAEAICTNWNDQNEEVYMYLMDLLLK